MISAMLPLWGLLDHLYYHFSRLQLVDIEENNIFRVRVMKYRGARLELEEGSAIQAGDWVLKIHLYNYRLMKQMKNLNSDVRRAFHVYQEVERSMPGLARYVLNHPESGKLKGIIGITLLNRGVKQLGFQTFPIANRLYRVWKQSYMIPMSCLCNGRLCLPRFKKMEPKFLVMSKEQLVSTYLNDHLNHLSE